MWGAQKLRILFLGYYDVGSASLTAKYYLRKALERHVKVSCYGPEGFDWGLGFDTVKLQKAYGADLILLQGRWVSHIWPEPRGRIVWENLCRVRVPKVLFFNELRKELKPRFEMINRNRIDMTLWGTSTVMDSACDDLFPGHKLRWLPWSVNTDVFKDYGYTRKYDVAALGATHGGPGIHHIYYPLRWEMRQILRERKDLTFTSGRRPSRGFHLPSDALIHEKYARLIANSKILLFDTKQGFALKKYFEGMACKTLVMAPNPYFDAERLHFKAGVNFVEINSDNFLDKTLYYLEHEKERERIAENGYLTVRKYHSCRVRAEQLFNFLEELA